MVSLLDTLSITDVGATAAKWRFVRKAVIGIYALKQAL
jgi:hypothetical protein